MDEELPPDLAQAVAEADYDTDRDKREPEGWLKVYVECPDCQVPMARTTVVSEDVDAHVLRSFTRSEHRAVCPECGEVASLLRVDRITASFDQVDRMFETDPNVYEGMLTEIKSHCEDEGWERVGIEIEELRDKISHLHSGEAEYNCQECDYVGTMSQPMQTMDMPMKTECPACGAFADHPTE